jgi:hypothetical protein
MPLSLLFKRVVAEAAGDGEHAQRAVAVHKTALEQKK